MCAFLVGNPAQGAFGEVSLARMKTHSGGFLRVAVKRCLDTVPINEQHKFLAEAKYLTKE